MSGIYYETGAGRGSFDYQGGFELVQDADGVTVGARPKGTLPGDPLAYSASPVPALGGDALNLAAVDGRDWRLKAQAVARHPATWVAGAVLLGLLVRRLRG